MAMGRDANRTVIVEFGQVRAFSDIHGRHVLRLDDSLRRRQDLAERLELAGCIVDLSGRDWHHAGDLTPPATDGLQVDRKFPKSQSAAMPQLNASYIDNGPGKLGAVEIKNNGPGDVLELDVQDADRSGFHISEDDLPVRRLPEGKSVQLVRAGMDSIDQVRWSYFTFTVIGKTVDGVPIQQELSVSR
jgi:hypothetical protein